MALKHAGHAQSSMRTDDKGEDQPHHSEFTRGARANTDQRNQRPQGRTASRATHDRRRNSLLPAFAQHRNRYGTLLAMLLRVREGSRHSTVLPRPKFGLPTVRDLLVAALRRGFIDVLARTADGKRIWAMAIRPFAISAAGPTAFCDAILGRLHSLLPSCALRRHCQR